MKIFKKNIINSGPEQDSSKTFARFRILMIIFLMALAIFAFIKFKDSKAPANEKASKIDKTLSKADTSHGILKFEIHDSDSNELIPGKLVFLKDGEAIELGVHSEGFIASRLNTIYTANGKGKVRIPAGTYEVWAGHGIEYSADVQNISIQADKQTELVAKIRREVETNGYISGDMHLHTLTYSGHGDANVEERLISCIAEGLEWAVATDHNHETDYAPVSQKLGISSKLATSIGNEVAMSFGHINVYPLPWAVSADPIPADASESIQKKTAFQLLKLFFNYSESIVKQINHPRSGKVNYFTHIGLDEYFATTLAPKWSLKFDAFEVMNGNRGSGWTADAHTPVSVRQDWFNLLNTGHRVTAVGNSDSHEVTEILAGMPRNYIASSTDDPANISESELARNIKKHNVSVNRGLYIEFSAGTGTQMGDQITARNGEVDLHIRVQAPHWVDCDSVFIFGNGQIIKKFAVEQKNSVERFKRTIRVKPELDTWYIVVASGSRSMAPLIDTDDIPITPLGFTNPIWVDADGDGKFTSLDDYAAQLAEKYKNQWDELIRQLAQRPSLVNLAIRHILENKTVEQTGFLSRLLQHANLNTRLLIYRELGRLANNEAMNVLKKAADSTTIPLERFVLEMTRRKLVKKNRRKKPSGSRLPQKDLEYLYSTFLNYRTGTRLREWHVLGPLDSEIDIIAPLLNSKSAVDLGASIKDNSGKKLTWEKYQPPGNGVIQFENSADNKRKLRAYIYSEFYSQHSGEMTFFLSTTHEMTIRLNDQTKTFKRTKKPKDLAKEVITLPVKRGRNQLLVMIDNKDGDLKYVLEPIDIEKWINPEMGKRKVHSHLAIGKPVKLTHKFSSLYPAGEAALTDGLRGSLDPKDGFWLGFEKDDFEAVIDLGNSKQITKISAWFLQAPGNWIFLPVFVEYAASDDGKKFHALGIVGHTVPKKNQKPIIKEFSILCKEVKARYVRVRAKNIGICPDWHPGAGSGAFLLVDEVMVQ